MNLLDRYVEEVGNHLPRKGRTDIEAEIRSTLQDMLDDRSQATGQPIDEVLIRAVLKEYGAPAKVAATYHPPQYLIGPRLYPSFELVIRIVMAVFVGTGLLVLALGMVTNPSGSPFATALGTFVSQTIGGVFSAFGSVVLVFAILERVLREEDYAKTQKEWDPTDLAKLPDPEAIKPLQLILNIAFTVFGLILLNLYSDKLGFGVFLGSQWVFIPVLSPAFFLYLPWINGLSVLQISFQLILLRQNSWSTTTRWVSLLFKVGSLLLTTAILTGPSIVAITPESLVGTPLAKFAPTLASSLTLAIHIGLVVAVIVGVVELMREIYKLVMGRSRFIFPAMK